MTTVNRAEDSTFLPMLRSAIELVQRAEESGLVLRLAGGLACWHHSAEASEILSMRGSSYSDMDFAAMMRDKNALLRLFESSGFYEDFRTATVPGLRRSLLQQSEAKWIADVSYDVLEYNHRIIVRDRVKLDFPTLSVSDLFLQKLQIVEFTQKDVCDAMMLVLAHEVLDHEGDCLNVRYLSDACSPDWGLWRTVTNNLTTLHRNADSCQLSDAKKGIIHDRLALVSRCLETSRKSIGWHLRSMFGERFPWYAAVDCV